VYKPGAATMWHLCSQLRARQIAAGIGIVDCLVVRSKPFVQAGRYEDEAAARRVDAICREHLDILCGQGGWHAVDGVADVLRAAGVAL
jgi:hypothetical protein